MFLKLVSHIFLLVSFMGSIHVWVHSMHQHTQTKKYIVCFAEPAP